MDPVWLHTTSLLLFLTGGIAYPAHHINLCDYEILGCLKHHTYCFVKQNWEIKVGSDLTQKFFSVFISLSLLAQDNLSFLAERQYWISEMVLRG